MPSTLEDLANAVGKEASLELDRAVELIRHCVDQLSEDQLWRRPLDSMNSIANLLLHLSGNVRQWIVSGLSGTSDVRNRQSEFDQRGSASKDELMLMIEASVAEAKNVLAEVSADELIRVRHVQNSAVEGIHAVFHSVSHFRGHTQEIVHIARCQLGDAYEFNYIPVVPEEERLDE